MKTIVLLIMLGISATVLASPLEDCRANKIVTNGMRGEEFCFGEEFDRLDKQVEKTFAAKVKRIPEIYADFTDDPKAIQYIQQSMEIAHRSWKKYREDYCRSKYEATLGTGASLEALYCDIRLTEQYLDEISNN